MATTLPRRLWSSPATSAPPFRKGDDLAGVRLVAVWGSPVGHVAALSVEAPTEQAKTAVGKILRLVGDAAAQVGRASPVVGVVVRQDDGERCDDQLRVWGADQDWHRGDFYLWPDTCISPREALREGSGAFGKLVSDLIGPLDPLAESVPNLEGTRSPTAILENVLSARGAADSRELIARLLHASPEAWGETVDAWTETVLQRARLAATEALASPDRSDEQDATDEEEA